MKRYLLIPALMLAALVSVGCSSGGPIRAEAPGGTNPQTGRIDSTGNYTLFHVTKFNVWAQPLETQKVASFELQANERVGFDYVMPKEKQWDANGKSDVVAFAGSRRINLGPIQSMQEKYYWAREGDWDLYWAGQPERVLATRAMMR